MISLPDVKFEKGCIDEVGRRSEETQLEGEFEAFGDIRAGHGEARDVRREGHDCVKREQQSVEEQPGDVVDALVENQAPEPVLAVLAPLVAIVSGVRARGLIGPGRGPGRPLFRGAIISHVRPIVVVVVCVATAARVEVRVVSRVEACIFVAIVVALLVVVLGSTS